MIIPSLCFIVSKVCCAKMADFRCKFSDAARRYIQLSYEPALHQDERMVSLKRAMICTILSSAGILSNEVGWVEFWMLINVVGGFQS